MRWSASAVALTALLAAPLVAQECDRNDTLSTCLDKFVPPVAEADADAAAERSEDATASAATGLTNAASPAESSLKDFLSLLAASLETATTSEQGQAFTFDWNPSLAMAESLGLKFQASFVETKLNDEVSKGLAENAEKLEELSDSLEFGDDAKLSGFVQQKSFTHGRSVVPHRTWFRPLARAMLAPLEGELDERSAIADDFNLGTLTKLGMDADTNREITDAGLVNQRIERVEALGRRMKASRAEFRPFFQAFAKLLNNQPQYYGAVTYHARRNLIGPNEWSGRFTYELAGNNLNAFRAKNADCKNIQDANAAKCARELVEFANAAHAGIERISVSLEYHKVNRRWINDPDAGLDLGFPRTRSFVGTVAFGTTTAPMLPLRAEKTGVGDARLDFTAKYELPEDDESEEKGFVGTLTYTQKISGTFSLPLSLVYSDHESDLIDVQKRFSARFGLMYKLPDFKGLNR